MNGVSIKLEVRRFDLVANISGPALEGGLEDWPSEVQDAIYLLIEAQEQKVGKTAVIERSGSDVDPDTRVAFVHVVIAFTSAGLVQ